MAPREIPVTVAFENNTLTASPTTVTLEGPEDWVSWQFDPNSTPPPANASLLIRFVDHFGPFQMIRGVGLQTLIAKGNKKDASPASYSYFLYLNIPGVSTQDRNPIIKSAALTIENQSTARNSSPWVTVTFRPGNSPEDPPSVDVEPPTLLLHEGDIAFMEFVDVPNDHTVASWFPVDGSPQGPFSTYFVTRKDGSGTVRLGGATFGPSSDPTISYGVRIWNAAGVLVAHKDPSIDNLGRPPGT